MPKYGLLTRRRIGQLQRAQALRTAKRIDERRRELEASGQVTAEDQRQLDDWIRWNQDRLAEAEMLLTPPPPRVPRRRQRDGGS